MDNHTFRVLEFEKVLTMLSSHAITARGRTMLRQKRPLSDLEEIRYHGSLISECRKLFSEGRSIGIENLADLENLISRVRPSDSILETAELRSFLPLFYSAFNLKNLEKEISLPGLSSIVTHLTVHSEIREVIEKSIDREGKLKDEASPTLYRIRISIKSHEVKIKILLEKMLSQPDLVPHLQDFYLAQRNNRWVIPVKVDSKGSVPGIVHDVSNTGETVYIEPFTLQIIGNELESYRAEEKLEEYKILRKLSALIRENLADIYTDYEIVTQVDSIHACAAFADDMEMSCPEINEKGFIKIEQGRHPLLWKAMKKDDREHALVPLNIQIDRDNSCMVITGSNAGGKTVTLKTIGVLCLMALSGMHIPCASGTTISLFNKVYADIGDDQSIEENMSTFSAHISRISQILKNSGKQSLIIIDELGTGTDPEQGGALSCAILRRLKNKGAISVVSTHLGMLKAFAHAEQGMINSAMEMNEVIRDNETVYSPTYKLVIGEPGTSHAFEIAGSLGLGEDLISEARGFITGEGTVIEPLIAELKRNNAELEKKIYEAEQERVRAEKIRNEVDKELESLRTEKNKTLSNALKEAEGLLRKTKTEAYDLIKKLKKARTGETAELKSRLDLKHKEIKNLARSYSPEIYNPVGDVSEGDRVYIKTLRKNGVIVKTNLKTGKHTAIVEGKEITVPLSELSKPQSAHNIAEPSANKPVSYKLEIDRLPGKEINLVGQRVDPALSEVERFINDASVSGLKQVTIIHGVGTGVLATAVRDFLKDHPGVDSFRKGEPDEGGEGVTIVEL